MGANPVSAITVEQYLAIDEAAERKSEYHDGELFTVVDATPAHGILAFNLGGILHGRVKNGCRGIIAPRVRVSPTRFVYPDAVIVCGEPQILSDSLTNPRTIIEILSPSTENYDAGTKFRLFQQLASFDEYVLIAQDQPRVDLFRRESPNHWSLEILQGLDQPVLLGVAESAFSLAELYAGITLPSVDEAGS
ncbi:MAG: Uma2 family endonuclease [Bryobacteraceae bacterium]|nr:Uma2 family endonuclease [Bryobacteraceae bacterium]